MSHTTPSPEIPASYPPIVHLDGPSVQLRIAAALRARSGRRWVVRGGPLEWYGKLIVASPPEMRLPDGTMTEDDRRELATLLGLDETVGPEGAVIVGGSAQYTEFIDRAEGRLPRVIGQIHPWDVA